MRLPRPRLLRLSALVVAVMVFTAAAAAVLDRLYPLDVTRLAERSTLVVDRDGRVLSPFTARDGMWRLPVAVSEVDARYLKMLIAYEDKRFESHAGVDPLALARAVAQWISAGRVVSGASTLTMQTVRLLEPRPRSIGVKLAEMLRALQLEWYYDKRSILGMYLALAPFGGNLEGVRAASLFYFGKEPERLTDAEAALLVALPQAPEMLRPDRHPDRARTARNRILERMAELGILTVQAAAEAAAQPVPMARRPVPRVAVHLADQLHRLAAGRTRVATYIDGNLQIQLEALARRYHGKLEPGATIALLVVENAGREVRAYVGSGDYFDSTRLGQNDLVQAVRSPGSTLKPFIYGIAFDDLLIHPETIVVDRPMRFGDYAPENFDKHYRGELSAREALQLSLNLPAVALLSRIGPQRFANTLKSAGTPLRLPDAVTAPGLPIALGGVGITLQDLVTLYAGIADGGRVLPLRYTESSPLGQPVAIMKPESAWYVTRILEESPPPPGMLAPRNRERGRVVAYKTGTSYGYRDAWAIGYDSAYTVGVWVGRPDGTFSPGRMGRDAAAPVLFEVFDMLPRRPGGSSVVFGASPPDGVVQASNGDLPLPLRRFDPVSSVIGSLLAASRAPQIVFPIDGVVLDLTAGDGRFAPLLLRASGGRMPLLWLINGVPISAPPFKRQAQILPDGAGATRITVVDRDGVSASIEVWIQ
jgi:penicillin-binding protein 1C